MTNQNWSYGLYPVSHENYLNPYTPIWAIVWTELWKLLMSLGIAQLEVVPEVCRHAPSLTGIILLQKCAFLVCTLLRISTSAQLAQNPAWSLWNTLALTLRVDFVLNFICKMNYLIANGRCKVHLLWQGKNYFDITNIGFIFRLFIFAILEAFSSFCIALFPPFWLWLPVFNFWCN